MSSPTRLSGPPVPGEEADADEAAADDDVERDPEPLVQGEVRARDQPDLDREDDQAAGRDQPQRPAKADHARSSSSARPERSAFEMKPRAPASATAPPHSLTSRLEVRITAGAPGRPVIRRATAKPSRSGRRTSRRMTSGSSSRAARSASPPSAASPTTLYPAPSSMRRALARKLGWSSTIRMVRAKVSSLG